MSTVVTFVLKLGVAVHVLVAVSPQVLNEAGGPKSLSWESKGVEDRVSARKVEKQVRGRPSPCRSMPPSKKLPAGNVPVVPDFGVYGHGAGVSPWLTDAQTASPAGAPTQSRGPPPICT